MIQIVLWKIDFNKFVVDLFLLSLTINGCHLLCLKAVRSFSEQFCLCVALTFLIAKLGKMLEASLHDDVFLLLICTKFFEQKLLDMLGRFPEFAFNQNSWKL